MTRLRSGDLRAQDLRARHARGDPAGARRWRPGVHLAAIVAVAAAIVAARADAAVLPQPADPSTPPAAGDTRSDTVTTHFVITAPAEAAAARDHFAAHADGIYLSLAAAFSATLATPITLRLLGSTEELLRANPVAVVVDGVVVGGRRGRREVAIVPSLAGRGADAGQPEAAALDNLLRRELALRFAADLSDDRLPDGFREGVAQYLEQPDDRRTPGVARLREAHAGDRLRTWADLNAPGALYTDPALVLAESLSVAHFLVGAHGWDRLVAFVRAAADAPGWRHALETTFGEPPSALEAAWRTWLPTYLDGGWRSHDLFGGDLASAEALLARGAFAAARARLVGAVAVLDAANPAAAAAARILVARADAGLAGRARLAEAEAALAAGDYAGALAGAASAGATLGAAGDAAGVDTAAEIARRAEIGRDAVAALDRAERLPPWQLWRARDAALSAAVGFAQLGNDIGADRARERMTELDRRLAPAGWSLLVLGGALLAWNARQRRRAPAP